MEYGAAHPVQHFRTAQAKAQQGAPHLVKTDAHLFVAGAEEAAFFQIDLQGASLHFGGLGKPVLRLLKDEFLGSHHVSGTGPTGAFFQGKLGLERHVTGKTGFGNQSREGHRTLLPRGRVRQLLHLTSTHHLPVLQDAANQFHFGKAVCRITVFQFQLTRRGHPHLDILIDFLHLLQLGRNAAVGRHNAVAAEVVVVGNVAKRASEIQFPVLGAGPHDGLVHPVPDAGAYHTLRLVLYVIPVFGQVADGVSHGVGILAEEERLFAPVPVLGFHIFQGRIHAGVEIGHLVLALIMHGTAVQGLYGIPFRHYIAALAALVAQAPEQHRGVQAVPADHPHGTVGIGRSPGRHVADGLVAVALLVRLVHYVKAVPVVEGIHLGVVGIVAGAHRVQVVALHQEDVLHHALHRHRLAMDGMDVVAVGPLQISKDIIDIEFVTLKLHLTEPLLEEGAFLQFSGLVIHGYLYGIKVRFFCTPQLGGRYLHGFALPCLHAVFVIEGNHRLPPGPYPGGKPDGRKVIGKNTFRSNIFHVHPGAGHQVHIPVDTAEAEHVLVFQVGAVAPFIDLHRQRVHTPFHIGRNVELGIVVGALAVAHLLSVHPNVKGRIHPVKMQINLLAVPFPGQGEIPAVRAHGIGFLLHGIALLGLDKGRIVQERIGYIGIERRPVPLHFPAGRHVQTDPAAHIVGRLVEARRTLPGSLSPVELPLAVEQQVTAGGRAFPGMGIGGIGHHLLLIGIRDERGMAGLLVDGEYFFILPVVQG